MKVHVRTERIQVPSGSETLAGLVHLPHRAHGCAVLSHGLLSAKDSPKLRLLAAHLAACGLAALRYDHRGCGESTGELGCTTVASRLEDLASVVRFAREHPALPRRIALVGSSMGGFISLLTAAADPGVEAVVLWATPAFLTRVPRGVAGLPDPPPGFLADRKDYDLRREAPRVRNCLILHGARDELVPSAHARWIYRAAAPPRGLRIFSAGDHKFSAPPLRRRAARLTGRWLLRHLGAARRGP
ncbi:MAG: alpha/beta hydrolase [Deferrisomatales bacterium]